jgi:hypothetical protein
MHLLAHRGAPRGPVRNFEAQAARCADGALRIAWRLDADLSQLRVPRPAAEARTDGLWRHTCFEAFIAAPPATGYVEWNFAPSGEWAAYSFSGYRTGMTALGLCAPPEFSWRRRSTALEFDASLHPAQWLAPTGTAPLRLALAAVIEDSSGALTYWALRHPQRDCGGEPDFHHPDAFILEVAMPRSGSTTAASDR